MTDGTTSTSSSGPSTPAGEVAAEAAQLGVSTVYEAGGRRGLVDLGLIRVVPGSRAAGPARIAVCGQDDNRAVHEVMAHAAPGDVLVLAMPEPAPVALVGELLVTQAQQRGVAAILLNGAVRDVEELQEIGLGVWAPYVRPAGATKHVRGRIDAATEIGGATVQPGDLVVLDADGAVVVARDRIDYTLQRARERHQREAGLRERFLAGELSYDLHGLRAEDEADDGGGS